MSVNLDDAFLVEVGLAAMPAQDRPAFLQHIYEEIELRVGTRLTEGLSDEQLVEFERIIDRNGSTIIAWVEAHAPDFEQDPQYRRIALAAGADADPGVVLGEYVATKWLDVNRHDYGDVVSAIVEEIKVELRRDAAKVLAVYQTPSG